MQSKAMCIKNIRLLSYNNPISKCTSIGVEDGKFTSPNNLSSFESAKIIDGKGAILVPGLVDIGLRAKNYLSPDEESFAQMEQSALRGGFTSVLILPEKSSKANFYEVISLLSKSQSSGLEVYFAAPIFLKQKNTLQLNEIEIMRDFGAKALFVEDIQSIDECILKDGLAYASTFELPVIVDVLCSALSKRGVLAESHVSTRLGVAGIPVQAETIGVYKAIQMAQLTGIACHINLISSAPSVDLVRSARKAGVNITASVSPWHLVWDEEIHLEQPFCPDLRLSPPLRTKEDRHALHEGIEEEILFINPDHLSHPPHKKNKAFEETAIGNSSHFTCFAWLMESLKGEISAEKLLLALSINPAHFLGIDNHCDFKPGSRANFFLFDNEKKIPVWEQIPDYLKKNTPLRNQELFVIEQTFINGTAETR